MTAASRTFPRSVKRAAYARCGGRCESCGRLIAHGGANFDHRIPWALSRDSSLDNCDCLCAACHLKKTASRDVPTIAKVVRIRDRAMGIKREGRKLPGGKDSSIKKKISGEVVTRSPRYAAHHAFIANRFGGGK